MVLTETPSVVSGEPAPDFSLPATDGRTLTFADVAGPNGTLVIFMCNHCPYVKAIISRLVSAAETLATLGVGVVAINPNDATRYPEDDFPHMVARAGEWGLPFPYLMDASQETARAYGAVCTPDFFGFNAAGQLQFRGRLDDGRLEPPQGPPGGELIAAMREIARTGKGPVAQAPSMGCSIKWRTA